MISISTVSSPRIKENAPTQPPTHTYIQYISTPKKQERLEQSTNQMKFQRNRLVARRKPCHAKKWHERTTQVGVATAVVLGNNVHAI